MIFPNPRENKVYDSAISEVHILRLRLPCNISFSYAMQSGALENMEKTENIRDVRKTAIGSFSGHHSYFSFIQRCCKSYT